MSGKYGVLFQDSEGNYEVVVVASQDAATALRDRMDERGVESYGTVRVVTEKAVTK